MGRAFEYRKASKLKRWGAMSKAFTKIGKEIAMAVKANGPNAYSNTRLKLALQNAKGVSMPKDRVEAAIKRASSKDEADYQEVIYEGYAAHGIAVMVECATDNINRTVASVRVAFSKCGGQMANSGALTFLFDRKGVFKFPKDNHDIDELELDLIDFGLEEIGIDDEDFINIYTPFPDFSNMQKALEERNIVITTSELIYLPNDTKQLDENQIEEVEKLLERLEEDDDVNSVYHNMA
ncbi:MAG: YebC/PmpR family DNA-binding transcriptional regulator [Candidatus Kapabacteria bacterium]|nr:YebC/PmpR family DNA-binding transcriptional regulator [Candidatus Kapabacteria bacterium]